jgi:hypothetical protein
MAKHDTREFPELPSHDEIRRAALGYISSGEPYLARDLTRDVAAALEVTTDQRTLRFAKNHQLAFKNYVSHVLREFTLSHIHTGPNGRNHKNANELYYVTTHGLETARRAPGMSADEIEKVLALSSIGSPALEIIQSEAPTADPELLETRIRAALSRMAGLLPPQPPGSADVQQVAGTATRFVRYPEVSAWVLQRANGICEVCNGPAPFQRPDGAPFLEIHHIRPLANGGPDTVDNTVASCPNCHRELHHGSGREALRVEVIAKTERLVDYPIKPPGSLLPETG